AFRQDQTKTRYASQQELLKYCEKSANPVGRMILGIGGCLDDTNATLSDHICTGLQLANFWQDVARDFQIDRVYLPADAMATHGVTESMLSEDSTPPQLRKCLSEQCDVGERHLRTGLALCERVPNWLSKDVRLFAHGGLSTIQAIRNIDHDVLRQRPRVARRQQLTLMAKACLGILN
ncbi:MAG: squalene/phytoene synthase family protein, partial [Planctomycetota bacterium]